MFANLYTLDTEQGTARLYTVVRSDIRPGPREAGTIQTWTTAEILDVIPEGPRDCVFHHADKTCYFATRTTHPRHVKVLRSFVALRFLDHSRASDLKYDLILTVFMGMVGLEYQTMPSRRCARFDQRLDFLVPVAFFLSS